MNHAGHPFAPLEKETVLECFQAAGTRDPDVLVARRSRLLGQARYPRLLGSALLLLGGLLSLTRFGLLSGMPVVLLGWWLRRRGVRNRDSIEAVFCEFTRGPGAGVQTCPASSRSSRSISSP